MKKIAWTRRGAHLVSQPRCLTQFLSLSGARWWPLDPPVHDLGYRTSRRTAVTFSTKWGRLSRVFPASARAYTLWANCYDGQDERTRRGANSMEALSEIVSFLKDEETKLDSLGGVVQFCGSGLLWRATHLLRLQRFVTKIWSKKLWRDSSFASTRSIIRFLELNYIKMFWQHISTWYLLIDKLNGLSYR